jgi:hypothetical protein
MGPLVANTWVHRAIVRRSNVFYFFQNGILQNSFSSAGVILGSTAQLSIGYAQNGAIQFYGHIDEMRVVRNIGVWAANFTPPTAPYDPNIRPVAI